MFSKFAIILAFLYFSGLSQLGTIAAEPIDHDADLNHYGLAPSGDVVTVAGNGLPGLRDGVAQNAEFLLPTSVAYDSHGRLLIVDQAAQRVRVLSNGVVTTIAGSGPVGKLGHVTGGYLDGPALEAKFNEPSGVVAAKDGTIYISDRLNHVIRCLKNGQVSTFAGSPTRKNNADGPKDVAAFVSPRQMSIDDDGNLYVADYGAGVREIDQDGNVTTLPFPDNVKYVVSVSAIGSKDTLRVYTSVRLSAMAMYRGDTHTTYGTPDAEPDGFFSGYAIAAVNSTQVLLTDIRSSTVRFLTIGDGGIYSQQPRAPVLVGNPYHMGFKQGDFETTELDDPLGIAIFNQHAVSIADTGNFRIRSFVLPPSRHDYNPGRLDEVNQAKGYKILYIGPSIVKYGVDEQHSIGGRIQEMLRRDRATIGLNKVPNVWTTRIDGLPGTLAGSWIESNIPDNTFNLIILYVQVDMSYVDQMATAYTAKLMEDIKQIANERHAKLIIAVSPPVNVLAPAETPILNDWLPDTIYSDTDRMPVCEENLVASLAKTDIPFVNPYEDMLRYEYRRPLNRHPLAYPDNQHPSPYGDGLYARNIVEGLEKYKPWSTSLP